MITISVDKVASETLSKFPVITSSEASVIEYQMKWNKTARKTLEYDGVIYDIRKMTDEESEKVWNEIHKNYSKV